MRQLLKIRTWRIPALSIPYRPASPPLPPAPRAVSTCSPHNSRGVTTTHLAGKETGAGFGPCTQLGGGRAREGIWVVPESLMPAERSDRTPPTSPSIQREAEPPAWPLHHIPAPGSPLVRVRSSSWKLRTDVTAGPEPALSVITAGPGGWCGARMEGDCMAWRALPGLGPGPGREGSGWVGRGERLGPVVCCGFEWVVCLSGCVCLWASLQVELFQSPSSPSSAGRPPTAHRAWEEVGTASGPHPPSHWRVPASSRPWGGRRGRAAGKQM